MKININNKKLCAVVGATFMTMSLTTLAENNTTQIHNVASDGSPTFVTGSLGFVNSKSEIETIKSFLQAHPAYGFTGSEDFNVKDSWTDELGKRHTRLTQTINGIAVFGTSMTLHTDTSESLLNGNNLQSEIYAVTGNLAIDSQPANFIAITKNNDSKKVSLNNAEKLGKVLTKPSLAYIFIPATGETKLSWMIDVKYQTSEGFEHDIVFFDVTTSTELARHPQVFRAKSYKTYNMNNQTYNSGSAPGTLVCSTGQSCSDTSAQRAHSGASGVYDYYKTKHARNGINNNDMTMISSVHTGSGWNNAVWYQNQMFYGDGDGQTFTDLTKSYDVIAHELTHGVTSYTAGLIYQNESGALNEAWSDIMGVSAKAYKNGNSIPAWTLGAEVYTPGTSGDALRYMDNPTQDGQSYDYYPERYTGTQDNGGVHLNSGIANLAFSLLVEGGTHPRNKTTTQVNAIGLAKAEKIFYRALTTYFNQSTNFASAKSGTAQAAQDLYGASTKEAVELAWCAVGVGSCSIPDGDNELTNGVTVSGLNASTGGEVIYTMDVPAGATDIKVVMSGGTGDADMYVKFGSAPTDNAYDCRPYKGGNNESCTLTNAGGKYYVRLKAYSTFSNVTLTGSYTDDDGGTGGDNELRNGVAATGLSASTGSDVVYTMKVPSGASDINFTMSGGSGDADMYVKFGSTPTDSAYDCRPYKGGNSESCSVTSSGGTYYIRLKAYSAFSGVSLTGNYSGDSGSGGGLEVIDQTMSNVSVSSNAWEHYTVELEDGYTNLTVTMSGGSGDIDLYVRQGAESTTASYDCRPYKNGNSENCSFESPASGAWYIDLRGYSSASGVTLNIKANP